FEEDSVTFVILISNNPGKAVLNWYRDFSGYCESEGINKTPKDFEYNLRERLFKLRQTQSITDYVHCRFLEFALSDWDSNL
ncbi:TPA: hypothetical protein N0F65_000644, partial [Lagenidium giganteum]